MKIKLQKIKKDTIILHLEGRFDPEFSEKVEEKLLKLIESGKTRIFVHCGKVEYIGSTGVKLLLLMNERLKKRDGWLRLISLPDPGRKILSMMGLLDRFAIYEDSKEALRSVK